MASLSSSAQLAAGTVLALASLALGYNLGLHARVPAPAASTAPSAPPPATVETAKPAADAEEEADSDEEEVADGDLSAVKAGWTEQCKLVLIVRTDLGMSSGKIAAQCSHATLACYKALTAKNPKLLKHWETTGQAKIALKASSEDQLLELEAVAKSLNLCARAIHDAGRTQVAAGSRTVLGIGPAPVELINRVTGKLRLL